MQGIGVDETNALGLLLGEIYVHALGWQCILCEYVFGFLIIVLAAP